eukprot:UN27555
MSELDIRCGIGVTSGLVYCGLVGAGSSREYGVLGDLVNLAARLMQAADGGILCSAETVKQIKHDCEIRFKMLDPIKVKGKTKKIHIYTPSYHAYKSLHLTEQPQQLVDCTVGRAGVLKTIYNLLSNMTRNRRGNVIIIEGNFWNGQNSPFEANCRLMQYY